MRVLENSQDTVLGSRQARLPACRPVSGPKEGYMLALWTKLTSRFQDEKGASMVEYALLVVLIAIVAIVAIRLAGSNVSDTFSTIADALSNT